MESRVSYLLGESAAKLLGYTSRLSQRPQDMEWTGSTGGKKLGKNEWHPRIRATPNTVELVFRTFDVRFYVHGTSADDAIVDGVRISGWPDHTREFLPITDIATLPEWEAIPDLYRRFQHQFIFLVKNPGYRINPFAKAKTSRSGKVYASRVEV